PATIGRFKVKSQLPRFVCRSCKYWTFDKPLLKTLFAVASRCHRVDFQRLGTIVNDQRIEISARSKYSAGRQCSKIRFFHQFTSVSHLFTAFILLLLRTWRA